MNFSKLRISPRHYGMDLMPGESDKITVTVKNPNNETVSVVPTVNRILPETSAKFYAEKTCLSVTWADASVSALVDMDRWSVVKTGGWRGMRNVLTYPDRFSGELSARDIRMEE